MDGANGAIMVITITIDSDKLPKDLQTQVGKQVQQIKRIKTKLPKNQGAINICQAKPPVELTITGFERITGWAITQVKPDHLDAFLLQLGTDICNLLVCMNCKVCPVRAYRKDQDYCHKALGQFCLSRFPRGKKT